MEKLEISRTKTHELAMICIFEYLFYHQEVKKDVKPISEIISDVMDSPFEECDDFFKAIVFETIKNKNDYIQIIEEKLINWKFERLCLTDQAILLLFTSELLNKRVPISAAIDSAVDLAHRYCDDNSYKKVNKVLDRISKENVN